MKKLVLFLFALLLISVSVADAAPDRTGHWNVGVNVAGGIPTDDGISAGVQVTGRADYGLNRWLALGFSGGWQGFELDSASGTGITVNGADLTGFPLFADFIFRVPVGDMPYEPYVIAGLGTVIWDVSDTSAFSSTSSADISTEVESSLAFKLGGGLDYFVNNNWILNFEAAYVFNDSDVTFTSSGSSATTSVELDYWTVGGGVKHHF